MSSAFSKARISAVVHLSPTQSDASKRLVKKKIIHKRREATTHVEQSRSGPLLLFFFSLGRLSQSHAKIKRHPSPVSLGLTSVSGAQCQNAIRSAVTSRHLAPFTPPRELFLEPRPAAQPDRFFPFAARGRRQLASGSWVVCYLWSRFIKKVAGSSEVPIVVCPYARISGLITTTTYFHYFYRPQRYATLPTHFSTIPCQTAWLFAP